MVTEYEPPAYICQICGQQLEKHDDGYIHWCAHTKEQASQHKQEEEGQTDDS